MPPNSFNEGPASSSGTVTSSPPVTPPLPPQESPLPLPRTRSRLESRSSVHTQQDAKFLPYDITLDPSDVLSHQDDLKDYQITATIEIECERTSKSSNEPLDPDGTFDSRAPDGGYGWIVVLASFMCNFTVDGICYTFGLFLPHFMAEFGSGKAVTALAGSLLSGCYMTAGLFVSSLVNRFGCRPVAIVGSLVAATTLASSTFVPSVYLLIATYGLLTGAFFGLIYLPSIVSVGYYFSSKRALATGIAVCGSGMGAFAFAPFVSGLLERFHWKPSLRILAGFAATCSLYGMLMKPLGSNTVKRPKVIEEAKEPKSEKESSSGVFDIFDLSVLRIPAMLLLSVANIFGMTGYYIPYVYIAGYAEDSVYVGEFKASPNEAAMLLSGIGIANVLGRLVFGVIADKYSGRRLFGSSVKITALLINNCCLLATGLTTIAIPFCPSYWTLMVDCVLFGFFISSYMSLTSIILVDLLGLERLSTTFGLIIFFRGISSIIGPPLAGLLYELTGSYSSVFVTAGLLILISSFTHALVHRYEK